MQSNIDELKNRIKEKIPQLTPSQKRIANFFLENPQKLALQSVRDLESELKTSKATIVRLTQALGYKGFQELKKAFASSMKNELEPITRYKSLLDDPGLQPDILQAVVEKSHYNLDQTLRMIDKKDFRQALRLLKKAHYIYTMGTGISYFLAELTAYLFTRASLNTQRLELGALNFSEQMINLSADDLVIAYSFPPYSEHTIRAAEYARERGMQVISITDKPTNAINAFSSLFLQVSVESTTMSNSIISPLALVYSLAAQIGLDLKSQTRKTIESLEHVRKEH